MKAISVSTFAIAAVAMMTVVPVTALPTAISLAKNASPTLPVVDGIVSFGAPAHALQTDLPTPTPTGVVRLDSNGDAFVDQPWNRAKKEKSPGKQQKEAEPKAIPKTPAQKKTEEAIFGPENPLNHLNEYSNDWARIGSSNRCGEQSEVITVTFGRSCSSLWAEQC
ncbi:hypothetical protein C8J55DRAFT_483962 [Lentinula edodes]|uniref:Uncharacterized protein n=1 Tax=Lentinula lateritia TaxID=40482 RepID=A0A9W9B1M7_9AGAR|nr:hypothetical protein C8J55DRAFT_483962 [Lentinula edodes]